MFRILLISTLFWILSLLIYRLLLKQFTFHRMNRWYLLLTLIVGAILPFLPLSGAPDIPLVVLLDPVTVRLNGVAATAMAPMNTPNFDYGLILWTIYGAVVAFLLMKFIRGIVQIRHKAKLGEITHQAGIQIVRSKDLAQPFSFWQWIFIKEGEEVDSIILLHETAHVRGGHSWDKILTQLLAAIYWIVPIFGYYRRYINEVQEYIADDYVLHHTSKKKYSYFLLGQTGMPTIEGQGVIPVLSNNFHSLIKNRITMILKKKTKAYKQLWYLPVVAFVFSMASLIQVSCKAQTPEIKVTKKTEKEGKHEYKMVELIDTVVTFDPATWEETTEIVKSEVKVYEDLDEMPIYSLEGCEDTEDTKARYDCSNQNLLKAVYHNIKYPKGSKEGGMIVLKFIVGKEGHVMKPEILKSFSPEFDIEVLKMFSLLQRHRWIPGRENGVPQAVSFILPIKFVVE